MRHCTRVVRRLLVVSGLLGALFVAFAPPAGAHPLGNFTVNRYARVEVSGPLVRVYYVLDEAEIPTFQDRDAYLDDFGTTRVAVGFLKGDTAVFIDGFQSPGGGDAVVAAAKTAAANV